MAKFRVYPNEEFREFSLGYKTRKRYAMSNLGRMITFTKDMKDAVVVKGSLTEGFKNYKYKVPNETPHNRGKLFHRVVAELFLEPKTEKDVYLTHLDYDKTNNNSTNLKWMSIEEWTLHQNKNPNNIAFRASKRFSRLSRGKLTENKVKILKKKLNDPNRKTRKKQLAKMFGISEMQLYRIEKGINWAHVVPDPEK